MEHPALPPEQLLSGIRHAMRRESAWSSPAEDLQQETAVRVLTRLRSATPPTLSAAYVRTAARNTRTDHLRRQARRRDILERNLSVLGRYDGPPDPETSSCAQELASVVRAQLECLPKGRQEAVLLFLQGYGVSEIAARTGSNRKQVDNLVCRGLAVLRRSLRAQGITPQHYSVGAR